jgi:hypothetical protein
MNILCTPANFLSLRRHGISSSAVLAVQQTVRLRYVAAALQTHQAEVVKLLLQNVPTLAATVPRKNLA